jgi:hypothetical protein
MSGLMSQLKPMKRMSWQFAADARGCGALRTNGCKANLKERTHG